MKNNKIYILLGSLIAAILIGCAQPEPPHVHTFSEAWTTDATSHWHAATCEHTTEVSGKADHQFPETWKLVTAATEEAAGLEERFCDICNYRVTQVIPQLNHNHDIAKVWSTDSTKHWHAASCGREEHNEDVAEHTEDSGTVTTAPTCTTKGVKIYNCTVCDAVLRTEDIPAKGHTEDSGTVTTAPTCGTKGIKTYKCTVCNVFVRTEEVPAKGHTEDSGTVTTAATCVTKGVKKFKCTVCKAVIRTEEIPELYSTPVTEEVNGTTYVYFGVWPQSVLPVYSTVEVDETVSVTMGANTYYLGSDGNYYAKCEEYAWGTGDQYKYHDGTQPGRGGATTRYFKVEPIKWRVLTDNYSGKKLLLAEEILTANVPYYKYDSSSNKRTVGSDTNIYPNNYKYSQIRAYLNGLDYYYDYSSTKTTKRTDYTGKGFLQTAFTQSAQALIAETDVDNSPETTGYKESKYATKYACENTKDKIFLLSESEVINSDYGFAAYDSYGKGNARIRFSTDYAKANQAYMESTDGYGGNWWLRSPNYERSYYAHYVGSVGYADYNDDVYEDDLGVVPALSISF